ncbi:MAG: type II toxin-antitoxin system RelE/ParE family toxin [Tannerellaceae bacterium]
MRESTEESVRKVIFSDEFKGYLDGLDTKIKDKYAYVIHIIQTKYVVSEKFIKKLSPYELYEVRVSVGTNEYRTILVAVDASNFMESKNVVFLNSFLKKSTKQYKSEIKKAFETIENMED